MVVKICGGLVAFVRFHARRAGFLLPVLALLLVGGFFDSGLAQSIPGVPSDQLDQLRQQMGGQGGTGANAGEGGDQSGIIYQDTIMQSTPALNRRPLPPSRLEQIMSARAGTRLEQFGYDQLGQGRPVILPQAGALQDDYILGPGDQIVVSLRGQENSEFRADINRNGQVILPRLNPIAASGRDFGAFRQDLEAAVHRAYVATDAYISVGRVRQISVLVSGEVNVPGVRLLTGLSSAVDALLLSGGVKKTGSLRSVRIQRGGRLIAVDLYNVLTGGGSAASLRLTDGDRIIVPPLGRTVAVTGLVRRPAIFELPAGAAALSVRSLLALAGGQEVRGRYRMSVLRIGPDGRSQLSPLAGETGQVSDSEILFVQLGADLTVSQATLSGNSPLAGAYAVSPGSRLSEVLRQPGALPSLPYTLFGVISRKDTRTYLRALVPFTPVAVLGGKEDQILQSDDLVRVLSVDEVRLMDSAVRAFTEREQREQEALRNPLSQRSRQQQNQAAQQQAASPPNGQSNPPATLTVQQQLSSPRTAAEQASDQQNDIREIGNLTQMELDLMARGQWQPGQPLPPGSYPSQQFAYLQQNGQLQPIPLPAYPQANGQLASGLATSATPGVPAANPATDFAGQGFGNPSDPQQGSQMGQGQNFALNQLPAANYQEQSSHGGSFPTNREAPTFNALAQQLGIDPLVLVNFFIDHQVTLDGAVRGPGSYFVGPNVVLQDLVQAAGGTIQWADNSGVELISTAVDPQSGRAATQRAQLPLHEEMFANYIVKPHDEFRFNQVFTDAQVGSVTVQGEVRFTGTYQITRGEHLSDLMQRAGGLTNVAYPYGTVFLRQSIADQERDSFQRAAKEVEDELVVAMTRIGTDKISPETFTSMQSFVNDLRNQQALGRISITADPSVLAAKPDQDPLLESGDVIYIPQRPNTVSVLGQVMQPGSFPYRAGATVQDYIERAGGYSNTSDSSNVYIVLPDGTARKVESSWLHFSATDLPPGSAIVVPRDVTPLDLRQTIIDVSQIFSQLAVSLASVVVLSRE